MSTVNIPVLETKRLILRGPEPEDEVLSSPSLASRHRPQRAGEDREDRQVQEPPEDLVLVQDRVQDHVDQHDEQECPVSIVRLRNLLERWGRRHHRGQCTANGDIAPLSPNVEARGDRVIPSSG